MRTLRTEIDIEAPAERVWAVLTDFPRYGEWNGFIPEIEGEARTGARLRVRVEPVGGRGMTFRPTVLAAEPHRELRWLGRLFIPRLFDGEHQFLLGPRDANRTHFIQEERFRGLLVPFFGGMLEKTHRGFEEMNRALKARCEANA